MSDDYTAEDLAADMHRLADRAFGQRNTDQGRYSFGFDYSIPGSVVIQDRETGVCRMLHDPPAIMAAAVRKLYRAMKVN